MDDNELRGLVIGVGATAFGVIITTVKDLLSGSWQSKAAREAGVAQAIETEKLRLRHDIAKRHLDSFHHHADGFRADLMEITSNQAQAVLNGMPHTPMNIVFDGELSTTSSDWHMAKAVVDDFIRHCDKIASWLGESGTDRDAWTEVAYRAITSHRQAALDALSHLIRMVDLSNDARIAGMGAVDTRGGLAAMADHWVERRKVYP
jgi:hypothetical protein